MRFTGSGRSWLLIGAGCHRKGFTTADSIPAQPGQAKASLQPCTDYIVPTVPQGVRGQVRERLLAACPSLQCATFLNPSVRLLVLPLGPLIYHAAWPCRPLRPIKRCNVVILHVVPLHYGTRRGQPTANGNGEGGMAGGTGSSTAVC